MSRNTETGWNYNMESCPLDTEVRLLSADGCPLLPQREYIGTVTSNGKSMVNGECYRGDPEFFYRSAIVAWKGMEKDLMDGKMERFKRLTERDEFGNADIIGVDSADLQLNLEYEEFDKVTNALNRLAEYEDLEEQGRIVRLPCAVGDEVYRVNKGAEQPIIPMEVATVGILSLKADVGGFLVQVTCRDSNNGTVIHYPSWEFGKSVFFSEEEAEDALKELRKVEKNEQI